jgi:hypothetical protein
MPTFFHKSQSVRVNEYKKFIKNVLTQGIGGDLFKKAMEV